MRSAPQFQTETLIKEIHYFLPAIYRIFRFLVVKKLKSMQIVRQNEKNAHDNSFSLILKCVCQWDRRSRSSDTVEEYPHQDAINRMSIW